MWYEEGLRFECTQCGQCCTGAPGYVWMSDLEMETIARFLKISKERFKQKYTRLFQGRYALIEKENYDCIFLKNNKCLIYDHRPKQCRTFPWWKQNLSSREKWLEVAKRCEGIHDKAPLISFEAVKKMSHDCFSDLF